MVENIVSRQSKVLGTSWAAWLGAGLLSMAMFPSMALAQKVGFVDVQRAVQATDEGKKARASLEKEFKSRKDSLDKKKADIDKMSEDFGKKKDLLSDEVAGRRGAEIQQEMAKFQQVVAENQVQMEKKQRDLVEPILEKMRKVIGKVAKEKSYSLVIEKIGQNVLYAEDSADLTDEVIKAFAKEK